MSEQAGPAVDAEAFDSVLAEVDRLIADRTRYRAALLEIERAAEPALAGATDPQLALRAVRETVARALDYGEAHRL